MARSSWQPIRRNSKFRNNSLSDSASVFRAFAMAISRVCALLIAAILFGLAVASPAPAHSPSPSPAPAHSPSPSPSPHLAPSPHSPAPSPHSPTPSPHSPTPSPHSPTPSPAPHHAPSPYSPGPSPNAPTPPSGAVSLSRSGIYITAAAGTLISFSLMMA
ncbi:hypothetical protein M569_09923 [Genlisea aurea]|uniref:Uncharacterized protein n=1 Tax=Genlisea aurea TaxID=192259 RepID=S8DY55_9LAMI|nr:hypothetical protein M569_09923 [Genlisea aurea]